MKYVIGFGGLGNMMFQYAFRCTLNRVYKEKCAFFVSKRDVQHNGYELANVFKIDKNIELSFFERLMINFLEMLRNQRVPYRVIFALNKCIRIKNGFENITNIFEKSYKNCCYYGIWESENYFYPIKENINEIFKFNVGAINDKTAQISILIKKTNSVSIHVRRGDYLSDLYIHEVSKGCNMIYYTKAINLVNERIENPTFFFFSDDMNYVKENLHIDNSFYVDFNKNKDSWQDMYLMSLCKHNIIANSTFSWWAAYLNQNTNKIVIAPKIWWYGYDTTNVIPEKWIKLEV